MFNNTFTNDFKALQELRPEEEAYDAPLEQNPEKVFSQLKGALPPPRAYFPEAEGQGEDMPLPDFLKPYLNEAEQEEFKMLPRRIVVAIQQKIERVDPQHQTPLWSLMNNFGHRIREANLAPNHDRYISPLTRLPLWWSLSCESQVQPRTKADWYRAVEEEADQRGLKPKMMEILQGDSSTKTEDLNRLLVPVFLSLAKKGWSISPALTA